MQKTSIAWSEYSSNPIYAVDPVTGKRGWYCTRVSDGCKHCYASLVNLRYGTGHEYIAKNAEKVEFRLNDKELATWVSRKKPARIFAGDMIDWCHEDINFNFVRRMFEAMERSPQHTYMLLTKRAQRMRLVVDQWRYAQPGTVRSEVPPNVWLGVSVENQKVADDRIPELVATPAAITFLSVEPLLSPVDLSEYLPRLSWVVCGGESGPRYRPMDLEWALSVKRQCDVAGVPFFFKQASGQHSEMGSGLLELDTARAFPQMLRL